MSRIARVSGRAVPIRGHDIDTDRIMPARFLKAITFDGLERHLFEDDRAAAPAHAIADARYAGAAIMVVNRNFGCGSSREHAPQGIVRRGIRAIVGESFSEIFFGNAVALGLPCVTAGAADVAALMNAIEANPAIEIDVDLEARSVAAGAIVVNVSMPEPARQAFLSGEWDAAGLLRERPEEIDVVANRLPYLRAFQ